MNWERVKYVDLPSFRAAREHPDGSSTFRGRVRGRLSGDVARPRGSNGALGPCRSAVEGAVPSDQVGHACGARYSRSSAHFHDYDIGTHGAGIRDPVTISLKNHGGLPGRLERCHPAVLVLDRDTPVTHQDQD